MTSPGRRREAVVFVQQKLGVSERRACAALGQSRGLQRRGPKRPDDEERLTELFTYLYNYDIGNVIDIPLNYYKDVIVYNSGKIAGYEFDSAPCFFDVARLTPQ